MTTLERNTRRNAAALLVEERKTSREVLAAEVRRLSARCIRCLIHMPPLHGLGRTRHDRRAEVLVASQRELKFRRQLNG